MSAVPEEEDHEQLELFVAIPVAYFADVDALRELVKIEVDDAVDRACRDADRRPVGGLQFRILDAQDIRDADGTVLIAADADDLVLVRFVTDTVPL